ncbi:MAG: PilZ domain-containing protein, partial [Desulfobacteraceae bacterium]|nr:PilZ domain-containing protein [Desulfobacteraceae bacterium]
MAFMFDFFKKWKKKRAAKRMNVNIMFQFQYDGTEHSGVLKNISINGFRLSAARSVEKMKKIDAEIFFKFKDSDGKSVSFTLNEKAEIKWVAPNRTMALVDYDAGCEFVAPDKSSRENLQKMLD